MHQFLSNHPSTVCNAPAFVLLELDIPRPAGMGVRMDCSILFWWGFGLDLNRPVCMPIRYHTCEAPRRNARNQRPAPGGSARLQTSQPACLPPGGRHPIRRGWVQRPPARPARPRFRRVPGRTGPKPRPLPGAPDLDLLDTAVGARQPERHRPCHAPWQQQPDGAGRGHHQCPTEQEQHGRGRRRSTGRDPRARPRQRAGGRRRVQQCRWWQPCGRKWQRRQHGRGGGASRPSALVVCWVRRMPAPGLRPLPQLPSAPLPPSVPLAALVWSLSGVWKGPGHLSKPALQPRQRSIWIYGSLEKTQIDSRFLIPNNDESWLLSPVPCRQLPGLSSCWPNCHKSRSAVNLLLAMVGGLEALVRRWHGLSNLDSCSWRDTRGTRVLMPPPPRIPSPPNPAKSPGVTAQEHCSWACLSCDHPAPV